MLDGGGSALTTGIKFRFRVPWACNVPSWQIVADQAGSCVLDLWKDTYTNYPPAVADTFTGAEKPTLSTAIKNEDTSLNGGAGWSLAAGDWVFVNVDSATTVTWVTLYLPYTRTI